VVLLSLTKQVYILKRTKENNDTVICIEQITPFKDESPKPIVPEYAHDWRIQKQ
jgi:hypothetical protein